MGRGEEGEMNLKIFIGYDSKEPDAWDVCSYSLRRHSTMPISISAVKQDRLRASGLYTRGPDMQATTEFSYTRFLVPALAGYKGMAMFVDCDFLFTRDIADLMRYVDPRYAVHCVKHDYTPKHSTKMDGQPQSAYHRKNWSSLMIFNCEHPSIVNNLTPDNVNRYFGSWLHQFGWARDNEIAELPTEWNFLVGDYDWPFDRLPAGIHFTNGGPWHEGHENVQFHDRWVYELALARGKQP